MNFKIDSKTQNQVSILIKDCSKDQIIFEHRADAYYHPASLIKLFATYAAQVILQASTDSKQRELFKGLDITRNQDYLTNLERISAAPSPITEATEATLATSDNDALSLLFDFITDSQSGLALNDSLLTTFSDKRKSIHKFFPSSKGFSSSICLINKCFSFNYYGRDRQLVELEANQITAKDTLKVFEMIKTEMPEVFAYMQRDLSNLDDYQAQNFIAKGLEAKATNFYSKAGWNSKVRHDVCSFELDDGEYLAVVMTAGLSENEQLISQLATNLNIAN